GRYAWASGVHQARWVMGGCMVFEGDRVRTGPHGGPDVIHVLVPAKDVELLDTWHTMGMRGTGSTEFLLKDIFVPEEQSFRLFGSVPTHPDPLFKLPTSFFGFALTAVPLGVARSTIAALKELAVSKKLPPPRSRLADQSSVQYTIAKTEAMVNAAILGVREAF